MERINHAEKFSGMRVINGVATLPLDGLWRRVHDFPADQKLAEALEYSGCTFYDQDKQFVKESSVAITGLGGMCIAYEEESDNATASRMEAAIDSSRLMMASSAAFSYLNKSNMEIPDLYSKVIELGHFSVGHTVYVNFVMAGISEGVELELSLQRDIVHLSKLTNTRTSVQNNPPIVVSDQAQIPTISKLYEQIKTAVADLRTDNSGDELELLNGFYPVNKATIIMCSGNLSNLKKLTGLREDPGKEAEFKRVLTKLHYQLELLWPEYFKKRNGEFMSDNNDYFADRLLSKLDSTDPIYAAFEAQDVSRSVGFDFDNFQSVVPRALDEIRETKEAEAEGEKGHEHFADEIADIMFSLVNLARHAGVRELPELKDVERVTEQVTSKDTIAIVDSIADGINRVAKLEKAGSEHFLASMNDLFMSGIANCLALSKSHGFNPGTSLKENVRKYLVRCQAIEQLASQEGKQWADLAANNEIVDYWKRAKILLN